MYCSGCGQAWSQGRRFVPIAAGRWRRPVPPVPGLQFHLESYAGKIRVLSIFWFIYGGVSLCSALPDSPSPRHSFPAAWPLDARTLVNGPMPPMWLGPALLHLIWVMLLLRAALAFAAGWGLMEHTQWGRLVAIVAAVLCLIKIPFGTAMGIWTLVMLLGYRNTTLYDQL